MQSQASVETNKESTKEIAKKPAKWSPPRGIRFVDLPAAPHRPHGVQWLIDGRRKTKGFATLEKREAFARSLAGDAKTHGIAAFRLDEDEVRAWRAFTGQIDGASLDDVLACWRRHGKPSVAMTLREATNAYTAAKTAEGVAVATLVNYRPIFLRFNAVFGARDVRSVTREALSEWISGLDLAPHSVRSHHKRIQSLFSWLRANRLVHESPFDGLKPVKIVPDEVEVLTVDQGRSLFTNNKDQPSELLGRLALEAFAGLRFSSAAQVVAADTEFGSRGISLPAAKIKTRRRQFIDGLPDNLWSWLEWSKPSSWTMTPRQYLEAKSLAFVRARVPHPHNCLRHSFATYHVAANKDVSRTAVILCHSSPKMLWAHYKGRATEAAGKAWFEIVP